MNHRAVLEIEECKYELLRFKYDFGRDTSRNGRPSSNVYRGLWHFQVESTDENKLLKMLVRKRYEGSLYQRNYSSIPRI